jgi:hypothetical protein
MCVQICNEVVFPTWRDDGVLARKRLGPFPEVQLVEPLSTTKSTMRLDESVVSKASGTDEFAQLKRLMNPTGEPKVRAGTRNRARVFHVTNV